MHETGLLTAAVGTLADAIDKRPLLRASIAVGPGVDLDAARHAWEHASAGTPAEGAEISLVRASDTLACLDCGAEYPGDRLTRCPSCNGNGLVIAAAPEVQILDYELRTDQNG